MIGNDQSFVKTINYWMTILRLFRYLAREVVSKERDAEFVAKGIKALVSDLEAQQIPQNWNQYTIKTPDGRQIRLKIELVLEDFDEQ